MEILQTVSNRMHNNRITPQDGLFRKMKQNLISVVAQKTIELSFQNTIFGIFFSSKKKSQKQSVNMFEMINMTIQMNLLMTIECMKFEDVLILLLIQRHLNSIYLAKYHTKLVFLKQFGTIQVLLQTSFI